GWSSRHRRARETSSREPNRGQAHAAAGALRLFLPGARLFREHRRGRRRVPRRIPQVPRARAHRVAAAPGVRPPGPFAGAPRDAGGDLDRGRFRQARAPRRRARGERAARLARQGPVRVRAGGAPRGRGGGSRQGDGGVLFEGRHDARRDSRRPAPQDGGRTLIVSHDLTIIAMIANASIVVKVVMGLLLAASMLSWFYIFMKI